jgi:hypothetical protein
MSTSGFDAGRLVSIAQEWLDEAAAGAHGGLDTGAPECGVCPLCRLVGALRTTDPAVVESVVDVVSSALVSVTDVLKEAGERLLASVPTPSEAMASESPFDAERGPTPGPAEDLAG